MLNRKPYIMQQVPTRNNFSLSRARQWARVASTCVLEQRQQQQQSIDQRNNNKNDSKSRAQIEARMHAKYCK